MPGSRHVNNEMSANHLPNDLQDKGQPDNIHKIKSQQKPSMIKATISHNTTYRAPCDITSKEALSALRRARTDSCKQQIADITCKIQKNLFYPKKLPRYCPLKCELFVHVHIL